MSIYLQDCLNDMEYLSIELSVFLYAIWTGCVVCGVYIGISFLRLLIKHTNCIVSIEDFLFWIFSSVYVFRGMIESCNGRIRWYYFLGIVAGAWSVYTIWYMLKKVINK